MTENTHQMEELSQVINIIRTEELHRLCRLYQLSPDELKRVEHEQLIQYSIKLPLIAQERVKAVFERAQIRYLHTAWKVVSQGLPTLSYRYIDWSQLQNPPVRGSVQAPRARKSTTSFTVTLSLRGTPSGPPTPTAQRLISSARTYNEDQVNQWCAKLENLSRAVLEEQGTSK